jgi:hypothetical protein
MEETLNPTEKEVHAWKRISNAAEFWLAYFAGVIGFSFCFTLPLFSHYEFTLTTAIVFALTTIGLLCGQLIPRPRTLFIVGAILSIAAVMAPFVFGEDYLWVEVLPLVITSVCIGVISVHSRFSLFWGVLASLLPTTGLAGLIMLGNCLRK